MNGIIIIDDNARLARSAAEFLGNEEFGPVEVCIDLVAARSVRSRMPLPVAVIADLQLPGTPFRKAAECLRLLWPHTAIIGWSAAEAKPETLPLLDAFVHKSRACQELPSLLRQLGCGVHPSRSAKRPVSPATQGLECDAELIELRTLLLERNTTAWETSCHRLLGAAQWTGDAALENLLQGLSQAVKRLEWSDALQALDGWSSRRCQTE